MLWNNGDYRCTKLGSAIDKDEVLQFIVPANTWFAAECAEKISFVLAGCTVAPGFDFTDFEMADKQDLLHKYPSHKKIISRLCR